MMAIKKAKQQNSQKSSIASFYIDTNAQQISPVNSLNAVGILLFCGIQKRSDLFRLYNPESIITGLALWYLQTEI